MPVYGDLLFCKGGCSWHSITIKQKPSADIVSCGQEVLPINFMTVNINMVEPHLDVTNYKDPWKFGNEGRIFSMVDGFTQNVYFMMSETQLKTTSH